MDVSILLTERESAAESTERRKSNEQQRTKGLAPETNPEIEGKITEGLTRKKEILTDNSHNTETQEKLVAYGKINKSDDMDRMRQETEEEEKEGKLVAGISHTHENRRGEKAENQEAGEVEDRGQEAENIKNAKHDGLVEREKEAHMVVSNLTPLFSTAHPGEASEIPTTSQIIIQPQNPLTSYHHNDPPSLLVAPTEASPVSTFGQPTLNHIPITTLSPGEMRSVLLFEDLFAEALEEPGSHLSQLEGKGNSHLEDVTVENISVKNAKEEPNSAV